MKPCLLTLSVMSAMLSAQLHCHCTDEGFCMLFIMHARTITSTGLCVQCTMLACIHNCRTRTGRWACPLSGWLAYKCGWQYWLQAGLVSMPLQKSQLTCSIQWSTGPGCTSTSAPATHLAELAFLSGCGNGAAVTSHNAQAGHLFAHSPATCTMPAMHPYNTTIG
jgi:hypothetical protein